MFSKTAKIFAKVDWGAHCPIYGFVFLRQQRKYPDIYPNCLCGKIHKFFTIPQKTL